MMKNNFLAAFLLFTGLTSCQCLPVFASQSADSTVMMQGFHWTSWKKAPWWGEIRSRAGEISGAGIDLVWLPPSSDSLSPEGYMPRKLELQDSSYGTAAQLSAAVKALHASGVRVIGDIVLNHRVGVKNWADFAAPAWGADSVCSDDEWGQGAGARDTGKGFHAARDIDHTKGYIQNFAKSWLNGLRAGAGYDGWRYDYARGFSPAYLLAYNRASAPSFAVAEIWDDFDLNNTDAHRQSSVDWIDSVNGEIKVFDFTTKGILQAAVRAGEYWRLCDANGRPSGLIGWWPANAVTFIDNHDTGPSPAGGKKNAGSGSGGEVKQNAWPFPSDKLMAGYAYILTHPGIPCVYWPHFFDWGLKAPISALIKIRREAGITSSSAVSIVRAEQGLYAALIGGRAALKLGDKAWDPGAGWKLAAVGPGYAVWTK
ncbi:MAG: alpha-amylase C-terminal beta-sheet domain-containing protein [Elusimicrobiota bacterium]|nr:alpha-amylase C-terminal beta-sheet domain-containing protein [Elusimicrobiota bacterium]